MPTRALPYIRRPNPVLAMCSRGNRRLSRAFFLSLGLSILFGLVVIALSNTTNQSYHSYLIPWIILLFFVLCFPLFYIVYSRSFSLFHPIVYAIWTYLFPAFVVGSLYFAIGEYEPWFMGLIPNPRYYLPLTLIFIILGFMGLSMGFFLPWGKRLGKAISGRLPSWDWRFADIFRPALVLIIIGELCKLGAFASGNLGYQYVEEASTLGATLNLLGLLSTMGSFLLWLSVFRIKRLSGSHLFIMGFLVAIIVFSVLLGGGRGAFLHNTMPLIAAYVFSKRRIRFRKGIIIGAVLAIVLLVGMIYGTVFRQIKGNESQLDIQEYFGIAITALDQLRNQGIAESVRIGIEAFLQRIETLSQLGVIVSNYVSTDTMAPGYGIPSIWTMTWTAFIPRAIWPDKPNVSGARGLGSIYFNYGESSPAITPIIDLLLNYGPAGVFIGMAMLGMFMRIIYSALAAGRSISAWRIVGYYLLLSSVSYEGFFGSLLPLLIRVCFVFLIGTVVLLTLCTRHKSIRKIPTIGAIEI